MNLSVLATFLGSQTSVAARTAAVKTALQTPAGRMLRDELGSWVIQLLPAEALVPEIYAAWRPLVRDAMLFMISHLSAARLAPKLVEQIELPPETTPEVRLLRLIAKVPGLQKIGQVLARNRHLDPSLRNALSELENGIHDVSAEEIGALIRKQLGRRLETHAVEIEPGMLAEATVSAVVRFTWRNPASGGGRRGVRGPRLIKPLSTATVTALSEEEGVKVTAALAGASGRQRRRVAEQLIEALIAVPLFARGERSVFHADPHAGNLLYDERTGELVLLDWALTESLTREQRRHVAILALMLGLRDPVGVCSEIEALALGRRLDPAHRGFMRDHVNRFIGQLPVTHLPSSMDAMRLLDRLALEGIRFPSGLMMFRKVLFTLDGILHDIAAPNLRMDLTLARHMLARSPLSLIDWIGVEASALLYGGRLWVQWAQAALSRAEV